MWSCVSTEGPNLLTVFLFLLTEGCVPDRMQTKKKKKDRWNGRNHTRQVLPARAINHLLYWVVESRVRLTVRIIHSISWLSFDYPRWLQQKAFCLGFLKFFFCWMERLSISGFHWFRNMVAKASQSCFVNVLLLLFEIQAEFQIQ